MACKYELRKNPSKSPGGSKYYHARPMNNGKADLDDICLQLVKGSGNTVDDIKAKIKNFIAELGCQLSEGKSVHIEGLGEFQMSLSCPPGTRHPEAIRAGSISVKGVTFKPSKQLVQVLRRDATFERTHVVSSSIQHCDVLLPLVKEYFADPANEDKAITSRYLAARASITPKKASEMLHEMVERKYLRNLSPDTHHPLYFPTERLEEV